MATTMTVPVTIARDALAFVDRLGQRREFERMIDRAKHSVPGLSSIEVALDEMADGMPPGVILWTHRDDIGTDDDPTQRRCICGDIVTSITRSRRAFEQRYHASAI